MSTTTSHEIVEFDFARPFAKWAGGKTQLLPELLARAPKKMDAYVEPFVGGGALFFALASEPERRYKEAFIIDSNPDLIDAYAAIRENPDRLIQLLSREMYRYDSDTYYRMRATKPGDMFECAARFIYLNKTCFNGLWRVNGKVEFNVPFGKFKNPPRICDPENLHACSKALQGVSIILGDFETALGLLDNRPLASWIPQSWCYFDSPYVPLSKTASFTRYAKNGFGPTDQARLVKLLREMPCPWLLSNADNAETRDMYEAFSVESVPARRSISCKGDKRNAVRELLVQPAWAKRK